MQSGASMMANLERVRESVRVAEVKCGREPGDVKILAVSKAKPLSMIVEAIALGQMAFGESYVQEAQQKIEKINNDQVEWHFIGSIQSNKTRRIASLFSWVHSIDRESIMKRLSVQRPSTLPDLNVCIQVNISGEETKSGVSLANIEEILQSAVGLPGIKVRGLMVVPATTSDVRYQRHIFAVAKDIFNNYSSLDAFDTLSMGMSSDFESAIAEGATMVRLGTAIFGAREQ